MIKVKLLSECSFVEACEAWNKGFADYYADLQMSVSRFTTRLGMDGIAPEYSVVAFVDGEPVGLILNGIKTFQGQKWAWNGGTSVARSHRRLGVAKELMKATLHLYQQENVDIACLEAFRVNEKAIQLYKTFGYQVIDHLLFLEHKEKWDGNCFQTDRGNQYSIQHGIPQDVSKLPFYQHHVPWKTRCHMIRDGESIIVRNQAQEEIGYALYQRRFDAEGQLQSIVLYQCAVDDNQPDPQDLMKYMVGHVFASPSTHQVTRTTYNLPSKNKWLVQILKEAGFKEALTASGVPLEQVFMTNQLSSVSYE